MRSKGVVAALASISLLVTPAIAFAQPAPQPQIETLNGDMSLVERRRRGFLWLPVAAVVLAALILYLVLDDEDEDFPASP